MVGKAVNLSKSQGGRFVVVNTYSSRGVDGSPPQSGPSKRVHPVLYLHYLAP